MVNALLWSVPLPAPEHVVSWFGAAQAQDYEPAKWALAIRTSGIGNSELDQAVDEGRILRTHALRPTWHFVAPEDIRWLQALTGPRVHRLSAHYYRTLELDEKLRDLTERLITRWIEDDGDLTRKEIGRRLGVEGIEAEGSRLAYVLMNAELNGAVCSGRRQGTSHTYALVSQRAPNSTLMSEDAALAELTLRYFRSHGPATIGDFRWWSSLTVAQIRRGLEALGDQIVHEKIADLDVWSHGSANVEPTRSLPTVHLLQPYDEYLGAFADTKTAIDTAGLGVSFPVFEGRAFYHAVIINGQLAGWWRRTLGRRQIELEFRLLRRLSGAERESLDGAAAAYGRFHDLPITLTVG